MYGSNEQNSSSDTPTGNSTRHAHRQHQVSIDPQTGRLVSSPLFSSTPTDPYRTGIGKPVEQSIISPIAQEETTQPMDQSTQLQGIRVSGTLDLLNTPTPRVKEGIRPLTHAEQQAWNAYVNQDGLVDACKQSHAAGVALKIAKEVIADALKNSQSDQSQQTQQTFVKPQAGSRRRQQVDEHEFPRFPQRAMNQCQNPDFSQLSDETLAFQFKRSQQFMKNIGSMTETLTAEKMSKQMRELSLLSAEARRRNLESSNGSSSGSGSGGFKFSGRVFTHSLTHGRSFDSPEGSNPPMQSVHRSYEFSGGTNSDADYTDSSEGSKNSSGVSKRDTTKNNEKAQQHTRSTPADEDAQFEEGRVEPAVSELNLLEDGSVEVFENTMRKKQRRHPDSPIIDEFYASDSHQPVSDLSIGSEVPRGTTASGNGGETRNTTLDGSRGNGGKSAATVPPATPPYNIDIEETSNPMAAMTLAKTNRTNQFKVNNYFHRRPMTRDRKQTSCETLKVLVAEEPTITKPTSFINRFQSELFQKPFGYSPGAQLDSNSEDRKLWFFNADLKNENKQTAQKYVDGVLEMISSTRPTGSMCVLAVKKQPVVGLFSVELELGAKMYEWVVSADVKGKLISINKDMFQFRSSSFYVISENDEKETTTILNWIRQKLPAVGQYWHIADGKLFSEFGPTFEEKTVDTLLQLFPDVFENLKKSLPRGHLKRYNAFLARFSPPLRVSTSPLSTPASTTSA